MHNYKKNFKLILVTFFSLSCITFAHAGIGRKIPLEDLAPMKRGLEYWQNKARIPQICTDESLRDCKIVSGPKTYLNNLANYYLTGRVKLVRIKKDVDLPIAQYKFDIKQGHYWSVRYEYLYWNPETLSFNIFWKSRTPNGDQMSVSSDYLLHPPQSSEIIKGEIDWAPFRKIYYNGGL